MGCLLGLILYNFKSPKAPIPAHSRRMWWLLANSVYLQVVQRVTYKAPLVPWLVWFFISSLSLCWNWTGMWPKLVLPSQVLHDTESQGTSQPQHCSAILGRRTVVPLGLQKGIAAVIGGCRDESHILHNNIANVWHRYKEAQAEWRKMRC